MANLGPSVGWGLAIAASLLIGAAIAAATKLPERLAALIRKALVVPRRRRKTRPTAASKERRIASKARRGETKRSRGRVTKVDE